MQSRQSFDMPKASGKWHYGDYCPSYHFPLSFEKQTNERKLCCSQTFHNYFLKGIETALAFTQPDADMRRDKRLASAALLALATFALSACGADDSPSTATSSAPSAAVDDAAQRPATLSAALPDASAPLAANPAAASDPIMQNMQASLAADSQQVAPVMHYAPGDSASNN
jgi:hypothetical protein